MKISKDIIVCLFCWAAILGCSGGKQGQDRNIAEASSSESLKIDTFRNVIVLLDLSSRVNLLHQADKDKAILSQILAVFQECQMLYGFQISQDKLDIKIALQEDAITQPFEFGDDLTIDMTAKQMNKPNFDVEKQKFLLGVSKLYEQAVAGPTTGADIWNFFDDHLQTYLKKSEKGTVFKNKVIILTDGYLEFDGKIMNLRPKGTFFDARYKRLRNKKNWDKQFETMNLALTPCRTFENTEVLMLEIAPYNPVEYTNEYQIIEKFWLTWFGDMKIKSYLRQTQDNPQNLTQVIKTFLNE